MRVHQVLVGASPGDAVTNIALAIDELMPDGVESSIWALYRDPRTSDKVGPVVEMPDRVRGSRDDVVIYHVSIGDPRLAELIWRRPERLVLHYHNITPAHFYSSLDPEFARKLSSGRSELRRLLPRAELVIADSSFNAEEIRQYSDVEVLVAAPPLDFQRLLRLGGHEPTLHHYESMVTVPMVLQIGQLLPHKRPELLIAAMHVLTVELRIDAAMVLVGHQRSDDYAFVLQRYIEELGLTNVSLAGRCTDAELVAYLRSATMFATTTAHEGFCVPVVEAFAFELPVVATGAGAVPETVGAGGLVLPVDCGPLVIAEAIAAVLTQPRLREDLVGRGRDQLERFSPERTRAEMAGALARVVG